MSIKTLPSHITSYDLIKTFAVITMIIDHVGYYFFPDEMWWRAVGRLSFPVWFFLIGYASSRDLSPRMLWGAAILVLANIPAGVAILPLNALVSIAIIRLGLDKVMDGALRSKVSFIVVCCFLFLIAVPTYIFTDYGSLGVMAAMFGYMVRHKDRVLAFVGGSLEKLKRFQCSFAAFCVFSFFVLQYFYFGFDQAQAMFVLIGYIAVFFCVERFEAKTYPVLTERVGAVGVAFLKFCGRRTLEIYIAHLLLFKALAVIIGVEGSGFMEWGWL